jgi:hypothetical protein
MLDSLKYLGDKNPIQSKPIETNAFTSNYTYMSDISSKLLHFNQKINHSFTKKIANISDNEGAGAEYPFSFFNASVLRNLNLSSGKLPRYETFISEIKVHAACTSIYQVTNPWMVRNWIPQC